MKAKNKIKNIFVILLLIIMIWLFTSCEYKKEDTKTKEITTNSEKKSEKKIESGNFKKAKEWEEIITVESSIWTWIIENANISPNWGGSVKGWTKTWTNPLNL